MHAIAHGGCRNTDIFSVIIRVQILLFELHGGSTSLGGVHIREGEWGWKGGGVVWAGWRGGGEGGGVFSRI